jgi:hypothetical protein
MCGSHCVNSKNVIFRNSINIRTKYTTGAKNYEYIPCYITGLSHYNLEDLELWFFSDCPIDRPDHGYRVSSAHCGLLLFFTPLFCPSRKHRPPWHIHWHDYDYCTLPI